MELTAIPPDVLINAVTAARNGVPPSQRVRAALLAGGAAVRIDDLAFDSLATMEFCISVELQTGAELSPDVLFQFETMAEVALWVAAQRTR